MSRAKPYPFIQVVGRQRYKGAAHPVHHINPETDKSYCQFENNYMASGYPKRFRKLEQAYRWGGLPVMCKNCEKLRAAVQPTPEHERIGSA